MKTIIAQVSTGHRNRAKDEVWTTGFDDKRINGVALDIWRREGAPEEVRSTKRCIDLVVYYRVIVRERERMATGLDIKLYHDDTLSIQSSEYKDWNERLLRGEDVLLEVWEYLQETDNGFNASFVGYLPYSAICSLFKTKDGGHTWFVWMKPWTPNVAPDILPHMYLELDLIHADHIV